MGTHKLAIVIMFITSFVFSSCGGDGTEMIEVEGGTFTMGATSEQRDADKNEKPTHEVTVSSFYITKYEVTQEFWKRIMGSNPSRFKGEKRPVEMVSWYDAVEFCNKLSEKEGLTSAYSGSGERITCNFQTNGYRLPTEAEWEFAARGGNKSKGYRYSGGNNLTDVGWYGALNNTGNRTQEEGTPEVGKKSANELGIYDMSGNVWEWCWDWYGDYRPGSENNPTRPSMGKFRVIRGGAWNSNEVLCRCTSRGYRSHSNKSSSLGLRLARTL